MAAQLGLESVDELEAALDSLEGIADDGGVLEGENLAREARIRSAYLDWCKEYGKEPIESRFVQFSSNFLEMEEYANENGKEMLLNEYADCTEEEYVKLMNGEAVTVEETPAPAAVVEEKEDEADAEAEAAAKAEEEAKAKAAAEAEAAAKAEEEAKAKAAAEAEAKAAAAKAEAEARIKAEEEKKEQYLAEKARLASMTEEEIRKEIEAEKSARQAAQAKELAKEKDSQEKEAIAAVRIIFFLFRACSFQKIANILIFVFIYFRLKLLLTLPLQPQQKHEQSKTKLERLLVKRLLHGKPSKKSFVPSPNQPHQRQRHHHQHVSKHPDHH